MMTPLPAPLNAQATLVAWRVDEEIFANSWDSGVGAERVGGRWNPVGVKVVYCALDPATGILEVAVHKGFKVLDIKPHVLTSLELIDASNVRVMQSADMPNPAWLHGGIPSIGQQNFGADLLRKHDFVAIPSAVSKRSWNLMFDPVKSFGKYKLRSQERLVLDTRLNPPP